MSYRIAALLVGCALISSQARAEKAMELQSNLRAVKMAKEDSKPQPGTVEIEDLILKSEQESGRRVVIDPGVRGRVMIFDSLPKSAEHSRREMLIALAINGFTVIESGASDTIVSARNAGRLAPVLIDQLPPETDEKILTDMVHLNGPSWPNPIKDLRVLISKDGDISSTNDPKALLMTDFTSSLYFAKKVIQFAEGTATEFKPNPALTAEGLLKDPTARLAFDFKSVDLAVLLQKLAPLMKKTIIASPDVRGKVTIQNGKKGEMVTAADAYRSVLSALQVNGYSIFVQGEFLRVQPSRVIQRLGGEVLTSLPELLEDRMVTYLMKFTSGDVRMINKAMRSLASKDGELMIFEDKNVLVMIDSMRSVARAVKIIRDGKLDAKFETLSEPAVRVDSVETPAASH